MRRVGLRIVAVAGSTLLALAAAEIALRAVSPALRPRTGEPPIVAGGEAGPLFRLRPGASYEQRWDGDPYGSLPPGARLRYDIDALGYRSGPEGARPTGLLVLGDSFTFGEGVRVGDRFADLLAGDVAAVTGGLSVYDAGVPGWSTLDEVAVLPELLRARRPRAVLIVAQPNDAVPIAHAQRRATGDLLALPGAGGLRLLALARGPRAALEAEDWYRSYWLGANRRYGEGVGLALQVAVRDCRDAGVALGVACFPLLHRLSDLPLADVHAEIGRLCRAAGARFLDLGPAFRGRDEESLWVHPTDHHPSGAAHRIATDALRPFVRDLLRRR